MTIQATSTADLLASIPHTLGFNPTNSLVLLAVGERGVIGATLRVDLPSLDNTGAPDAIAAMLRKDASAIAAIAVLYYDGPTPERWQSGYEKLGDALEDLGILLRDVWMVTDATFYSLCSDDPEDCVPTSVEEIHNSAVNAELVYHGSDATRRAVVDVPAAPAADLEARMRELITTQVLPAYNGVADDLDQPYMHAAQLEWFLALDSTPKEESAARLLAYMSHRPARDRLVADTVGGGNDPEQFRSALIGRSQLVNWEQADLYQDLATHLLTYAPAGEIRANLLCMIAFVEWHKGHGSRVCQLLQLAKATDSGHRLTTLLDMLMNTGILPDVSADPERCYRER